MPAEKTLAALAKVRRQLPALCEGGFVDPAENVLVFGLPGRGKTHGSPERTGARRLWPGKFDKSLK